MGPYRLGFYCHEARLCVEMDGEQHDPSRDAKRDCALAELGIATYRVSNRKFFRLDDGAYQDDLDKIVLLCEDRAGRKAFPNLGQ